MRFSRWLLGIVLLSAAAVVLLAKAATPDSPATLAATPPMGWNSWDSFGESVAEADVRANALWMAQHLKEFGWQYIVVDMGWYVTNHSAGSNAENAQFSLDEFGRFTPAVNSIPSAAKGAGFKALADYIHSLGLKFGIHILRGIPKEAVRKNLPIAGSSFHAADAANTSDTCPWNPFNYGLDASKPAAQAYYDSIAQQYAGWGVDFLKVDCIADHPYKGDDIRMLSQALRNTGRPIVLSLSPGPAALENAEELSKYAQMWRISDDVWDLWHSDKQFPSGIENQFARAAKWAPFSGPGHWPDADMLPLGRLEPVAGWENPRATRLTHDEQRTLLTLWAMFRSPLMMGGNLTLCDKWTESLLTNSEIIAVNQRSYGNREVMRTDKVVVWQANTIEDEENLTSFTNISDYVTSIEMSWKDLGLPPGSHKVRELWQRKDLGRHDRVKLKLAPHSSVIYKISKD